MKVNDNLPRELCVLSELIFTVLDLICFCTRYLKIPKYLRDNSTCLIAPSSKGDILLKFLQGEVNIKFEERFKLCEEIVFSLI